MRKASNIKVGIQSAKAFAQDAEVSFFCDKASSALFTGVPIIQDANSLSTHNGQFYVTICTHINMSLQHGNPVKTFLRTL